MTLDDEKDPIEGEDEELVETPEPVAEPPADPNEPIEVVTDDTKQENAKARRVARQSQHRQMQEENARLRAEKEVWSRQQTQQAPPQQQQMHPAAQRLREIDNMEDRLHKEYEIVASQAGYDRNGPQEAEYRRQARAIQVARMAAVQQAATPQINEQELMRKMAWQQFTSEHSDVFQDQKAQNWAIGRWQQLVHGEGKADTRQLAEEILDQARVRFGMKPRKGGGSTPTASDRQRFAGVSARGGSPSQASPGAIQMSADDKKMARLAFLGKKINGKEMNEQQAYQRWANTVGKKRQEQEKGSR